MRTHKPSHDQTTKPAKGYYIAKGAKIYNTTIKVAKHPSNQPTTAAASARSDPRPNDDDGKASTRAIVTKKGGKASAS